LEALKRCGRDSLPGGGSLIGGGFSSSMGSGVGDSCGGGGGSFIGEAGSLGSAASMYFSRCAANATQAFAIVSSERFASRSLKLWTSRRHFAAFRRYRSANSVTRQIPDLSRKAHFCVNGDEKNSFRSAPPCSVRSAKEKTRRSIALC
jgi:hypothetical protein